MANIPEIPASAPGGAAVPAIQTVRSTHYMPELDGLRALAVAAVAWSHWAPHSWHFGLPWGSGVQLFFVLSGFLITGILLDASACPTGADPKRAWQVCRNFFARRILRIFPLFYLTLSLAYFFDIRPIRESVAWHAAYASNFYFFLAGGWGEPVRDPFRHFWSLAVEEQFYLVWPFLILWVPRVQLWKLLLTMVLAAPVFSAVVGMRIAYPPMSHVLPLSCLDALGIGALLACVRRDPFRVRWGTDTLMRACFVAGVLGVAFSLGAGAAGFHGVGSHTLGHFSLVLVYGWVVHRAADGLSGPLGAIVRCAPLVYLGKISYGLYVIHNLAPEFCGRLVSLAWRKQDLIGMLPLKIGIYAVVTITLAMLSWHLFEKPINNLKARFPYPS